MACKYSKKQMVPLNYTYVSSGEGHRRSYNELFSSLTGLVNLIEPPSASIAMKLIKADRLLFSTMENDTRFFLLIAFLRALLGRETSAIVMNVDTSLRGSTLKHLLKSLAYRIPTLLGKIDMVSILPNYLDSRFEKLSNRWIYDPQFWDLAEAIERNTFPKTELANQVVKQAGGRPILLFLGSPSIHKGFDFLYEGLQSEPNLGDLLQVVVAGKAPPTYKAKLDDIHRWGGITIDRYLSDDEVVSLNKAATCLWACYHPSYNSSSGVFGRAIQLSKGVIVNRKSMIERIAAHLDYPVYACSFGDTRNFAEVLNTMVHENSFGGFEPPSDVAGVCREVSIDQVFQSLKIK